MGTALLLSIISAVRDRQELQRVTEANDILRKTLGEMTVAITDKDKQIDELEKAACPPAPAASPNRPGERANGKSPAANSH
jgi:hypothetical protein